MQRDTRHLTSEDTLQHASQYCGSSAPSFLVYLLDLPRLLAGCTPFRPRLGKHSSQSYISSLFSSSTALEPWCLYPISMQTKLNYMEPVWLIALKIMLHAQLCLSVIIFLIWVCWHPKRICRALSSWGQRGQVMPIDCLNHTACYKLYRVPVLYFVMMHLVITKT